MIGKNCVSCGQWKLMADFYKHPKRRDGRVNRCVPCHNTYMREWYQQNKAAHNTASRDNYARSADEVKLRQARYRDENRIAVRARVSSWDRRHAGAKREATRRYQARKVGATPSWANRDILKLYYIYAEALGMHVDHIVPLKSALVCGLHCEANLQLLAPSENVRKHNRYWPDMP